MKRAQFIGVSGALEEDSIKETKAVDVAPFLIPHLNFDEIIFHEPDPLGTSQVPIVTNELKEGNLMLLYRTRLP